LLQLAFEQRDVLFLFGGEFGTEVALQAGRQLGRQPAEVIACALFHFQRGAIQLDHSGAFTHLDAAEEPAGEKLVLIARKLNDLAIEMGVLLLFQLVQVVQFGFEQALLLGGHCTRHIKTRLLLLLF